MTLTRSTSVLTAVAFVALMMLSSSCARLEKDPTPPITAAQRATVVDSLTAALIETYVYLETAEEMRDVLHARLGDGEYDDLSSSGAFARRLEEDLRSVSHDLHLKVRVPRPPAPADGEGPCGRSENYCFQKVEILPENIGYLKFNNFVDTDVAGPTAVAAMNFLANTDALIIDLRGNGGGDASMVQLISSYFFEERVHLNSFYYRQTDEWEEIWTLEEVEGPRMTEVPIFVLVDGLTFSAAEGFAYHLKARERATIVGETTRGGAHPVTHRTFQLEGFSIDASIPFGRAVNPITGTNWEGTGVEPDIQVSAGDALDEAIQEASRIVGG